MNKFNFKSKIMAPVIGTMNKNKDIENMDTTPSQKVIVMTPQEKKDEEIYKEEQEITHEINPEKEKYLPGEKLLKKLNKSKRGHKKRTKKNDIVPEENELNDEEINKLITLLKRKRL